MTAHRDLDRERQFLTDAARGHEPFVRHATSRLDAGEELYGDSWAWIGVRKHLTELLEEAADLGAWAVLADQALDLDPGLSDVDRIRIRAALQLTARNGAQAHTVLTGVLAMLKERTGP